jgi:hypothetical protein
MRIGNAVWINVKWAVEVRMMRMMMIMMMERERAKRGEEDGKVFK